MKILKSLLAAAALLVASLVAVPAILPSQARVERTVEISASPSRIYNVLIDLNQFKSWNPWAAMEPDVEVTVEGTGVGATYAWEGDQTGTGKMTLTRFEADRLVELRMNFVIPFESEADVRWKIDAMTGGTVTRVTWEYNQQLPYFMRYFGLRMDSMLGGDFEKGLASLKQKIEGA